MEVEIVWGSHHVTAPGSTRWNFWTNSIVMYRGERIFQRMSPVRQIGHEIKTLHHEVYEIPAYEHLTLSIDRGDRFGRFGLLPMDIAVEVADIKLMPWSAIPNFNPLVGDQYGSISPARIIACGWPEIEKFAPGLMARVVSKPLF